MKAAAVLAVILISMGPGSMSGSGQEEGLPQTSAQAREAFVELKFSEFFKPVGPRALEYSDKPKGLNGRPVRIVGYMVKQEKPSPGLFLFAVRPIHLEEDEMGLADDLPAATLHVHVPTNVASVIRFTPGPLALTGLLSLGTKEEADGRLSSIRLTLSAPPVSLAPKISAEKSP